MPPALHRYDLLAIDLDGTLVNSHHTISKENLEAIDAARAAGIRIVICTGRGLKECREFLSLLNHSDAVAVAGGSIIADPRDGSTIHRFEIPPATVASAVCALHRHGHAAMILKDPHAADLDYLVVQSEHNFTLDPVMDWWFERMNLNVKYIQNITSDPHPAHSVRIGAFGINTSIAKVATDLTASLANVTAFHHFPAVVKPEHALRLAPGEKFHILELFSPQGNKWAALQFLANQLGIPHSRIAAIGDEINDISMISNAGLGIAMGNAIPEITAVATRSTTSNDLHGVAHAISNILRGTW